MSDGYSHGPYNPISDKDILDEETVQAVLKLLPPHLGNQLSRHMMASERRASRSAKPSDALTKAIERLASYTQHREDCWLNMEDPVAHAECSCDLYVAQKAVRS